MTQRRDRTVRSAFTLIELLVVIAIIAILAAILFPVFAQAKLAAKKTQDLSNMKQVGLGLLIYIADFDDNFPLYQFGDFSNWPASTKLWSSVNTIGPYTKNYDLLLSPADSRIAKPADSDWTYGGAGMPVATRPWHQLSYLSNSFTNWGDNRTYWGLDSGAGNVGVMPVGTSQGAPTDSPVSQTAVSSVAQTVLFANGLYDYYHNFFGMPDGCLDNEIDYCYGWKAIYDTYQTIDARLGKSPSDPLYLMWRQFSGKSNFAFSDGHSKSMAAAEMDQPKYWLITQN